MQFKQKNLRDYGFIATKSPYTKRRRNGKIKQFRPTTKRVFTEFAVKLIKEGVVLINPISKRIPIGFTKQIVVPAPN